MQSIDSVVREAQTRFGVANVCRAKVVDIEARTWALRRAQEEGHTSAAIARAFGMQPTAVRSILRIDMDLDPDEALEVEPCGPTRMLPIVGSRRECVRESECLSELLRACLPRAPAHASCPSGCASHAPPRGEGSLRLGGWAF